MVECGIGGWRCEDGGVGERNRSGGRSEYGEARPQLSFERMRDKHTAKQIVPTQEDKKSNIKSGLSKGQWNGENRIAKGM